MNLTQTIARIPILGYLSKVFHDVLAIPIIRRDLHTEILTAKGDITSARRDIVENQRLNTALRNHLNKVLADLSTLSNEMHDLRAVPDGLRSVRRAQLWIECRLNSQDPDTTLADFKTKIEQELDQRLEGVRTALRVNEAELERRISGLDAAMPLLAAKTEVASVRSELTAIGTRLGLLASADQHSELRENFYHFRDHAEQFLQTIRSELLAEVDLRLNASTAQTKDAIAPRIVNPGKLLQFTDGLRLNLGSGPIALREYLNVDSRELRDVDILADVGSLPFGPGSISELRASHLLEHFKEAELSHRLLPYWNSLLKPGGLFHIVVPDAEGMLAQYARSEISFDQLRLITFGGQDYDGNYHFTMFSRNGLQALLRQTGFQAAEFSALNRPNGDCLEMEILATKVADHGPSA